MDAVKEDVQVVGVRVEDAENRVKWKTMIRCGDAWQGEEDFININFNFKTGENKYCVMATRWQRLLFSMSVFCYNNLLHLKVIDM